MQSCPFCRAENADGNRFCRVCGKSLLPPVFASGGSTTGATPLAPVKGRLHIPLLALVFGIFIPGAGQAYNGRPFKAFFLLLTSVLILPYLYSLYDAFVSAQKIAKAGGRMGRGGIGWVFLQIWLYADVIFFVILLLTVMGVLK